MKILTSLAMVALQHCLLFSQSSIELLISPVSSEDTESNHRLEWESEPGTFYTLERSNDMLNWTKVNGFPKTSEGIIENVDIKVEAYPVFFRVSIADPSRIMVLVEGGPIDIEPEWVDSFFIGSTEVTWREWKTVRDWASANGYEILYDGEGCADDHPVVFVYWYDVVKWCNAKSEMEGLTPVYALNGDVYRSGYDEPIQDIAANGYRLPLDIEWVFAARGGNLTNGYIFSGSDDIDMVAWYAGNSDGAGCKSQITFNGGTFPVGQKLPNELGLYDMTGNVWEWCWDRDFSTNTGRIIRGGSTFDSEFFSRIAERDWSIPNGGSALRGFRLVRSFVE